MVVTEADTTPAIVAMEFPSALSADTADMVDTVDTVVASALAIRRIALDLSGTTQPRTAITPVIKITIVQDGMTNVEAVTGIIDFNNIHLNR